ncbi:hypothetical protein JAAARDRAFT_188754 [Jaapia argillacea MUCL 33604]|uniref:Uncharacterized protein n=1 Tax=Jaapia argillacea MUCL 33604 TaxID=933084 RepID=A0A067QI02_9AGAM|nr:hypothetical protein JAAARDRAFT_188754 [Jaapia argillacea MUCL 33604]
MSNEAPSTSGSAGPSTTVMTRLMRALSVTKTSPPYAELSAGDSTGPATGANIGGRQTTFEKIVDFVTPKGKKESNQTEFPPPYWFDDGEVKPRDDSTDPSKVPLPPTPGDEVENPSAGKGKGKDKGKAPDGNGKPINDKPPEPSTVAQKIRDLISSILPDPSSPTEPPSQPPEAPTDGGPPQPPPGPIHDSKLIKLLSSAAVMNGTISKGRQSVWSMLDKMKSPFVHPPSSEEGQKEGTGHGKHEEEEEDDDDSSVMLYGPLLPMADSEVELARSEIISPEQGHQPAGEEGGPGAPVEQQPKHGRIGWPHWPWSGKGKGKEGEHKSKPKKVWVPSPTQISLQVMWWGFRIYLPPPVLAVLNNTELEAAKRAAMITAALKWLVDHIPVSMLPPQVRPAVILIQRLLPYVGYIGAFIAWSWSAIKSYDKGNGVILTATWLLPMALIPGSWPGDKNVQPAPVPPNNAPVGSAPNGTASNPKKTTAGPSTKGKK